MLETWTGVWRLIDWYRDRQLRLNLRAERHKARDREKTTAKERIRRDNTAAAFDRKIQRANAAKSKR
jgi:hypothetical protein